MKYLKLNKEMKKGKVDFISLNGFSQMMLSFYSLEEENKNLFKRKTNDIIIEPSDSVEAYHCDNCKIIIPIIEE